MTKLIADIEEELRALLHEEGTELEVSETARRISGLIDKRVSELIRYNSEQVVLRRLAEAKLRIAVEALNKIDLSSPPGSEPIARFAFQDMNALKAEDFGRP